MILNSLIQLFYIPITIDLFVEYNWICFKAIIWFKQTLSGLLNAKLNHWSIFWRRFMKHDSRWSSFLQTIALHNEQWMQGRIFWLMHHFPKLYISRVIYFVTYNFVQVLQIVIKDKQDLLTVGNQTRLIVFLYIYIYIYIYIYYDKLV